MEADLNASKKGTHRLHHEGIWPSVPSTGVRSRPTTCSSNTQLSLPAVRSERNDSVRLHHVYPQPTLLATTHWLTAPELTSRDVCKAERFCSDLLRMILLSECMNCRYGNPDSPRYRTDWVQVSNWLFGEACNHTCCHEKHS
jgi:hypothetical protein